MSLPHSSPHTPPIAPASECPVCGASELLEIKVSVLGEPVSTILCGRCEWRQWSRNGEAVTLVEIVDRLRLQQSSWRRRRL